MVSNGRGKNDHDLDDESWFVFHSQPYSPKNISTVISWFQQESLYIWNIIKNLTRLGEYPNVSVINMGLPDNSDTHNWKYDDYQMDSG